MTRSDLIEIIARVIGEHDAPDYVPDQWREEAAAILSALSAAGLAVVPREATEAMKAASYEFERKTGFVGELSPRGLNHSTVFEKMLEAGDLAQDRAMVAAEDLTG